jgi:hypothetical protein
MMILIYYYRDNYEIDYIEISKEIKFISVKVQFIIFARTLCLQRIGKNK